jgi:hypothetical protein
VITLRPVPLFGSSTNAKSRVVTVQRRLNCYFEQRKDGDKTKVSCYGTPGLAPKFTISTPGGLPIRGWLGTQSALYLVAYNQFQSVNNSGGPLFAGTVSSTATNCVLATNGTQTLIADGGSGYIYTPAAATFAAIPANYPPTARTVTFVSGFFAAEQPGSQKFWVSNANDGSTWNALAFASASAYSDNIVAVDNLAGNLVTFSEQHTEFWQNAGLTPQPFVPILSAANEYGLAAIYSRAHVAESLMFLAQNREGQKQVVRLNGFTPEVVSDPDIESLINGFSTTSDAEALAYGTDTHKFYQITFPTAGRSFLYDTATGLWSEAQTGASVNPTRHNGRFSTYFQGQTVVSDYATSQVYTLDPNAYTDNGATIIREVTTRHVLSEFNRVRVAALYLDMETGVGLQAGQGSNPQIMLQYSKDNGRTWSAERWVSLGAVGKYFQRVIWRRFGSTRDATFKIRMSDPVKFVITQGAMKVRQKRAA